MVKRRGYALLVTLCITAMLAVDIIAKLGYLKGWSTTFDVLVNLALLALAATAYFFGIRADRKAQASSPDNDY